MAFGERLQALRRGAGLTQEAFAQQLKVSRQSVSKWESCRGYPELEKIIYICNHYRVSMDELFQDEVPQSPAQTELSPQGLKPPPLKASLSNFFANLSPRNQLVVWAGVAVVALLLIILSFAHLPKGASNPMLEKVIWTILLLTFAVGEAISVGLTSIWFATGALVALVCALLGGSVYLQLTLFVVVSALCLLAMRPLAQRYLNNRVEPTNADRILGTVAPVTQDIDNLQATGTVRIGGTTWSARSEHNTVIPAGTLVRVLRIEGVKVYVEPYQKEESVC